MQKKGTSVNAQVVSTTAVTKALDGEDSTSIYVNYLGQEVLGSYKKLQRAA